MTYLDTASTVPLHPAAREVLLAAHDEGWADPTRLYGAGRRARMLLDDARARAAAVLAVRPDEVTFPASGTAAIEAALAGTLAARARAGAHLVTSAVEHSAVLAFARDDADATVVGVSRTGRVDPAEFAAALRADTAVASLQHANHEVGTVQPLAEVAAACAERGVPLHTDAAVSVGRVAVEAPALLTASAHKWGGPPGVGVLVVRKGTRWRAPSAPGFPNVPAVLAATAALEAVTAERDAEAARLGTLVDLVRAEVARRIDDVEVAGEPVDRLPHVVTFSCLYVDGEALVTELDRRGFAVNSGSSCGTETGLPSHVLTAMGVLTHGNVRVSLGRDTTEDDVRRFLDAVTEVVADVRRQL